MYLLGDITISIDLYTGDGLKSILLGNINYSYRGKGTPEYEILNAEEVKETLMKFLNLKSINDTKKIPQS